MLLIGSGNPDHSNSGFLRIDNFPPDGRKGARPASGGAVFSDFIRGLRRGSRPASEGGQDGVGVEAVAKIIGMIEAVSGQAEIGFFG